MFAEFSPDTGTEYSPKNIQGIFCERSSGNIRKYPRVIRMFAECSLNNPRRIFGSSIRGIFSEYSGNISNRRTPNTQRIFAQTFPEHSLNIFLLPGPRSLLCRPGVSCFVCLFEGRSPGFNTFPRQKNFHSIVIYNAYTA